MLKPTIERFLSKINVVESGCWEWTASKTDDGYGLFYAKERRNVLSHRFIFEYYYGELSPNLTIDHLCNNPNCANPIHLEEVTQKENIQRGHSHNGELTQCKRGHEFTIENTIIAQNKRRCRTCVNTRRRVDRKRL